MCVKFVTVLFLASLCHHALGREFVKQEVSGKSFSYKLHPNGSSWQEAERTCESEGARLAVIESEAEASVLGTLIEDLQEEIDKEAPGNAPHYFYAIGLSKAEDSQDWKTISGTPLGSVYTKWARNNPSPFSIPLYGFIESEGLLYSFSYDGEGFICKK